MRNLVVVAAAALVLLIGGPAAAQPAEEAPAEETGLAAEDVSLLPAGTSVTLPGGQPEVLPDVRFLLSRAALDQALADSKAGEQCRADYNELAQTCARLAHPAADPRWVTALKWVGVGALVGTAFAGGLYLGAKL